MSTEQTQTEVTTPQAPEQAATEALEAKESSAEAQDQETAEEKEANEVLEAEEKPKKKSGIQRLKERHAREMAAIHREIEAMKSQANAGKREEPVQSKDKPRAEQFETHEEFVEALTDWKFEQKEKLNAEKSKEAEAKSAYENQRKAHNERVAKFREENPDYDDAIEEFIEEHGDMQFSFGLQQAIMESEEGPALILELAKDPALLKRINGLSVTAAAREIGKLEARLAKTEDQPKEVKLTKAPKPPTPIAGKSAPVRKSIFDEDLSFSEYVRMRRDSERKKA